MGRTIQKQRLWVHGSYLFEMTVTSRIDSLTSNVRCFARRRSMSTEDCVTGLQLDYISENLDSESAMALLFHRQSSSSYTTCIRTVLRFYSTTHKPYIFNPNTAVKWISAKMPEEIPKSKGLPEVGMKFSLNIFCIIN